MIECTLFGAQPAMPTLADRSPAVLVGGRLRHRRTPASGSSQNTSLALAGVASSGELMGRRLLCQGRPQGLRGRNPGWTCRDIASDDLGRIRCRLDGSFRSCSRLGWRQAVGGVEGIELSDNQKTAPAIDHFGECQVVPRRAGSIAGRALIDHQGGSPISGTFPRSAGSRRVA
jgi:hypothetical protein